MRQLSFLMMLFICIKSGAQICECEKEFIHIKDFIEHNYVGFTDKIKQAGRENYNKQANELAKLTKAPHSEENCLLILSSYLDWFKDHHIQIAETFDALKTDSAYISRRENLPISDDQIKALRSSTSIEGIYNTRFDTAYTIAVIKDKNRLSDYTAIMIHSKWPTWKKGMVKFRARKENDSLLRGVLFMRNHLPKMNYFFVGKTGLEGDWQREGTVNNRTFNYVPVESKSISDGCFYIKISSFDQGNAHNIDSLFKVHADILKKIPTLILDLRDNGGGADFAYAPLIPYVATGPVKTVGVDVLATDANIEGWRKILEYTDIPDQQKQSVRNMISKMEANKNKLVNIVDDEIDSSFKPSPNPGKVIILINRGCASTTEQFLLLARQSSKVILVGASTQGTLDYSNMRETNFSCMPYVLKYSTTRSRRLDIGQGIDNAGIKPNILLEQGTDWINEAVKIAEKK